MKNLFARFRLQIVAALLVAIVGGTAVYACPATAFFVYEDQGYALWCNRIGVVNGYCLMDCAEVKLPPVTMY